MKKLSIVQQWAANIRIAMAHKRVSQESVGMTVEPRTVQIMATWLTDKEWTEDLSFDEVSRKLGISKQQISLYSRWFHHKPFLSWRRELRIEEAKSRLLDNINIPASLIGVSVGIPDKSNFRRQFKETTGLTPVQWRESKH